MIRRIAYNEIECDDCGNRITIWEGHPALKEWLYTEIGDPKKGYLEVHYCPSCKPKYETEGL